jgi:hypothetical protein
MCFAVRVGIEKVRVQYILFNIDSDPAEKRLGFRFDVHCHRWWPVSLRSVHVSGIDAS